MTWTSGIMVYAVIWWITIFMVLPFGNQAIDADDVRKGHASSAPKRPRLLLKMAINTLLSGAVWLIIYAIMESGLISLRN